MAANTSSGVDAEKVARLASLFASAVTLIIGGKRGAVMIDTLLKALQLFKEGKLSNVFAFEERMISEVRGRRETFRNTFVDPWLKGKSTRDPETVFEFSDDLRAMVSMSYSSLVYLLQAPESNNAFSHRRVEQRKLAELKRKLEGFGMYLGMSQEEVEEAFGPLDEYCRLRRS